MPAWLETGFRPDPRRLLIARLFLKVLALIYLAAFLSLAPQVAGLVGPDGILPVTRYLTDAVHRHGILAPLQVPTLFWFSGSAAALQAAAWAGVAFSMLLLFGVRERLALAALFVLYLSLYRAGQIFTNFQWDTLLLEAGLLALFLQRSPTGLVLLLFHWLLFRLRFMSGWFKLASGDPSWWQLTALDSYFETQPLPHIGAWFAHWLPPAVHTLGTALALFSELVVPFFLFLPRPWRLLAVAVTLLMQLLILATSNHNFFNLLTIALCLLVLDDRLLNRLWPRAPQVVTPAPVGRRYRLGLGLLALLIPTASLLGFWRLQFGPLPTPLDALRQGVQNFGIGNAFHVFPVMQTERQELIVEGSNDGRHWRPYPFRYKPQALDRRPPFIVPHQPRLDWAMWFVPTQRPAQLHWFGEFMYGLERGSPAILSLLAGNPFPEGPPRRLRVQAWRYRFTTPEAHARTGRWWQREYLGEFPMVPPRRP